MGGKRWLGALSVIVLSAACDQASHHPVAPEVGDDVDGGKVIRVSGAKCSVAVVSYDSEWQCSAEQIEAIRGPYAAVPVSSSSATQLPEAERVALVATDCEGLAARRRPALKAQQQQALEHNRRALLANKCVVRTGTKYYLDGVEVSYCSPDRGTGSAGASSSGSFGSGNTSPGAPNQNAATPVPQVTDVSPTDDGATEYSTTNTQVVGVDEADFVKNDDGHVYVLSTRGLHVIDAWPAPETKQVKLLPLPGEPRRLYLAGDKLVVYSRLGAGTNGGLGTPSEQGCTYGYDCRFSAEPGHTLVIVYDVSAPSEPQELRRFELSGSYVDSRRVGDIVYTVVQDGDSVSLPGVDLTLEADSAAALEQLYRQRATEADAAIDAAPAASFLPWVHRVDRGNAFTDASSCDSALAAQAAQSKSFLSLVSFDLSSLGQPWRTLIAGKPGYVYASEKALYVATDGVDGGDTIAHYGKAQDDRSTLHKFALDGIKTSYRGSSPIAGHVLNQFSMDELSDVMRVATSSGWVPNPDVSSNLTTLAERDGKFVEVARIGGIAPTEDIRSVRFDGTRAFVVTFKKTDPLFVFDLTLPEAPRMLGELKIPGFSTYMHPIDHDHLLAIGFDADDHGGFAYFDGIQLQIFDVSNLYNPQLLHKTTVGTRGSASEALTNHLAFNYFPAKGVLALPMSVCEGGDDGKYGDKLTFSGLMVFDVSLENGIKEHGRMPFVNTEQVTASWGANASCSTWWANSTSDVKRSIFMDDFAIGISDTLYQVAPLSSLSTVAQSLPLAPK
jgi:uncharacterized secreted protein with C-terminal beta-propeller domain